MRTEGNRANGDRTFTRASVPSPQISPLSAPSREAGPGPGLLRFPTATGWEKHQPVRLRPSPGAAGETRYPLYRWERVAWSLRPLRCHTPTWLRPEKPRLMWSTPARNCAHAGPDGQKGSLLIHRKPAGHVRAQQGPSAGNERLLLPSQTPVHPRHLRAGAGW